MAVEKHFEADVQAILSHRHDNGGDLWATPDKRLIKGAPFTTLESVDMLLELGMEPDDSLLEDAAALIWSTWQPDGRFRVYPKGGIYPCQTVAAAEVLCKLGYTHDKRMQVTCRHLLDTVYTDGGWRCGKFSFGRGPETEYSNPLPTLTALNVLRMAGFGQEPALDRAVGFLLDHWTIRTPIGPCHYGIGTLFMQVEYPFRGYNLFYYVYVLSFFGRAREDERFQEAFETLRGKTADGRIVVERAVPKLAKLDFCRKGRPSELATRRYREILRNLDEPVDIPLTAP